MALLLFLILCIAVTGFSFVVFLVTRGRRRGPRDDSPGVEAPGVEAPGAAEAPQRVHDNRPSKDRGSGSGSGSDGDKDIRVFIPTDPYDPNNEGPPCPGILADSSCDIPVGMPIADVPDLIRRLKEGTAVGSSYSQYSTSHLAKIPPIRLTASNYFGPLTREAFSKVCDNDNDAACKARIAEGIPVWMDGVECAQDAPFLNCLKSRAQKCIDMQKGSSAQKQCFDENVKYVADLDNFGTPRIQKNLARMLEFIEDMRREARTYEPSHPLEKQLRDAFLAHDDFFRVQLFSRFKHTNEYCGKCTIPIVQCPAGCVSRDGVTVPNIFDPYDEVSRRSGMYTFLHELGHVLVQKSRVGIPSGGYRNCVPPPGHHLDFHMACLFLARMAARVLKGTSSLDVRYDYRISNFHDCYDAQVGTKLPSILRPEGPWTI